MDLEEFKIITIKIKKKTKKNSRKRFNKKKQKN